MAHDFQPSISRALTSGAAHTTIYALTKHVSWITGDHRDGGWRVCTLVSPLEARASVAAQRGPAPRVGNLNFSLNVASLSSLMKQGQRRQEPPDSHVQWQCAMACTLQVLRCTVLRTAHVTAHLLPPPPLVHRNSRGRIVVVSRH